MFSTTNQATNMSSNRSKNSKRLSLRKNKIAKSPITKKRAQSSLGLPISLTLNPTNTSTIRSNFMHNRPKSANSTSSKQSAIQNLFENTSIQPRSWKTSSSLKSPDSPSWCDTINHGHTNDTINHGHTTCIVDDDDEEEEEHLWKIKAPSLNTENLSAASSICDILECLPMSELHEDSDDEERTKTLLSKLDPCKKQRIPKIQSHPVLSGMQTKQSLFATQTCAKTPTKAAHIFVHNQARISTDNTSPSS
eukprot:544470_1